MPSSMLEGANSRIPVMRDAERRSERSLKVTSMGVFIRFSTKTAIPEIKSISDNVLYEAFWSANLPPSQYPKLKLPNITPIRLVQINVDEPSPGASTRDPTISRIITTAPDKKIIVSSFMFIFITLH